MAPEILPYHIVYRLQSPHRTDIFSPVIMKFTDSLLFTHYWSRMKWKSSLIVFRITKSQLKRNAKIIVLRNTLKVKWDRCGSFEVKQVLFTYMNVMRLGHSNCKVTLNSNYTGWRKRSNKFQKRRNEKFPWKTTL